MTTRTITNFALLIVVLILLGITLYQPPEDTTPQHEPLFQLNSDAINRISIVTADEQQLDFKKESNKWFVNYNGNFELADDRRIKSLIDLGQVKSLAKFEVTKDELEKYQLKTPLVVLQLNDNNIAFGSTEPFSNRRYVQIDNTVHIISDYYYPQLLSPPVNFLNKHLIPEEFVINTAHMIWSRGKNVKPEVKVLTNTSTWKTALAQSIENYQNESISSIIRIQGEKKRIEFGVIKTRNQLKLARPDLGLTYVIPSDIITDLLLFKKQPDKAR